MIFFKKIFESCFPQQKFYSFRHISKRKFNSLCHLFFWKKVQFFDFLSNFRRKDSILWVTVDSLVIWKKVQKSLSQISSTKKKRSILWVFFLQSSILGVKCLRKGFNSSRNIEKKVLFLSHIHKEGSILWVILKVQFLSQNQEKKSSILSLIYVSHIWKICNSVSHIQKRGSILWIKQKNQFFESYFSKGWILEGHIVKKKKLSHWVILKKNRVQFLWVIKKKKFNPLRHLQKRVLFFESCWKNVQFFESYSILWVILKKFNFWVNWKKFNSSSHLFWVTL